MMMTVAQVLADYSDGDELGWDYEFRNLEHRQRLELDALEASIRRFGIQQPILLGDDGRVWDGHHRLCVAKRLGINSIPVEYAGADLG